MTKQKQNKSYYQRHKTEILKRQKQYYRDNKEARKEYQKERDSKMKDELSKHFDLTNLQHTPEQRRIARMIAEIQKLQKDNRKIMEYIRIPYGELNNDTIIDILKKVMQF